MKYNRPFPDNKQQVNNIHQERIKFLLNNKYDY